MTKMTTKLKACCINFILGCSLLLPMAVYESAQGRDAAENIFKTANTPAGLDDFITQKIQDKMTDLKVAGATLALVHNGRLIYANGFGDADSIMGRTVKADHTLFRWGSISKTITWTAMMQLIEQGKVSLEADVNDYLTEISIPATFDKPIQIKHLFDHSAGFEDAGLGHVFETSPDSVLTLKDYLLQYQPKRVRPAGEAFAYSNYASALAGRIIENVSGMSYEKYVQANILEPLGMKDSTFLEPLPASFGEVMEPRLVARLSRGFKAGDAGPEQTDEFTFGSHVAPAGTLSSTAIDMAKFARMHLENCELDGVAILQPATCTKMHSVLTPFNAGGEASMNYGFVQHRLVAGHRRLGHNGGIRFFHSQMGLYPDLNFAFLMSTNTDTGQQLYDYMESAIVEHLFGDISAPPADIEVSPGSFKNGDRYSGYYQNTRRNYSSIETLASLLQNAVEVEAVSDGLLINTGTESVVAIEVAPNLFRARDKADYYEFVENSDGDISYMKAMGAFDRVAWYEAPQFRVPALIVSFLSIVIGLLTVLIRSLKRFSVADEMLVMKARRRLLFSLGAWTLFVIMFCLGVVVHLANNSLLTEFPSPLVLASLTVGVIACFSSLLPIISAVDLFRNQVWSTGWRWSYLGMVLVICWFAIQLNDIHLIGFNFIN